MRARWLLLFSGLCLGAGIHLQSRAFVPVPAVIYAAATTTSGSALSGLAAIGALLGSIAILNGDTNDTVLKLQMPAAVKDVPSGWSAASDPTQDPVPPSTATATNLWHRDTPTFDLQGYATAFAAASAACTAANRHGPVLGASCGASCQWYGCDDGPSTFPCTSPPFDCFGQVSIHTDCPSGYTSSNGTCVLSNAASVNKPVDNRCGLKFSGGTMSFDSRDPDCSGTPPPGVTLSSDQKTLTALGTNGTTKVQIQVNPNGSVTVTTATPQTNGTTKITQTTVSDPAAASNPGRVTQYGESTVVGQGPDAVNANPTPVGTSLGNPITFPDDYAREATAQSIRDKLSTLHDDLTRTDGPRPDDPQPKTQSDFEGVFFPNTFQSLLSWQLPSRAVACPTWSFSLWSQTYTIDAHCALIEQQRVVMSTICLLVYGLLALFIVLGA